MPGAPATALAACADAMRAADLGAGGAARQTTIDNMALPLAAARRASASSFDRAKHAMVGAVHGGRTGPAVGRGDAHSIGRGASACIVLGPDLVQQCTRPNGLTAMPIPPRPRFQRPPPRPSDWEPVPIPQPVDAIHTSDPPTPTVREMEDRERQRASLAADLTSPWPYALATPGIPDAPTPPIDDAGEGIDANALALDPADTDPCAAAAAAVAPEEIQSQAQQNVPRLMAQTRAAGLTDDQTAYVLGTIEDESGFGASMVERHPRNYEGRRDIGNVHPGDGRRFVGRGFVQITGRDNYAVWGKRLKLDLIQHPELATDPDVAAAIAVRGMRAGTFTGKSLNDYINGDGVDYVNARRVINGTDRASLIASYADRYRAAIHACRTADRPPTSPSDSGRSGHGS